MKKKAHIQILMLAVLLLTGCNQLDDTGVANNTPVDVSLTFSVSNSQQKNTTRQTNDVVQPNGSETFRGLQMLRVLPFAIDGNEVTGADRQKVFEPDGSAPKGTSATSYPKYTDAKIRAQFYYINDCSFASGTNAVLAYAQAAQVYSDKERNGSLVNGIPVDRSQPASEIEFSLENILPDNNAPEAATLLAAYFTDIAKTSYTSAGDVTIKWSNTDNSKLKGLFMNFVGQGATDYQPLPSSAACAKACLADLYKELTTMGHIVGSNLEEQLRQTLITKTTPASDGFPADFPKEAKEYPASAGLPDGAAVIRWYDENQEFKPETETSTLASITSISRYAYPAELWFCANSKINTSYSEVSTNDYSSATDWASLLAKYTGSGTISPDTKAAAITNPLQYAVAHLKIALNNVARTDPEVAATLKDSKEEDIVVGSTNFPLTGIIVGRQYPQDYNFTPLQPISDVNESFAYDRHMVDASGNGIYLCEGTGTTNTCNTLLLQTPSDQKKKEVSVALEFRNNSNQDFHGKNGIVYKGTKFYLLAKVNPTDATAPSGMPASAQAQVLTRDYITTLTLRVASLKEAYNVLPDLTSARLELGVEVVTKWEQATPTEITID